MVNRLPVFYGMYLTHLSGAIHTVLKTAETLIRPNILQKCTDNNKSVTKSIHPIQPLKSSGKEDSVLYFSIEQ